VLGETPDPLSSDVARGQVGERASGRKLWERTSTFSAVILKSVLSRNLD